MIKKSSVIKIMNNFQILIIGIFSVILSDNATAQYRDFTNNDGKVLNALLVSKTDNEISVLTKDGKKYTLKKSVLTDTDNDFISKCKIPEFTLKVFVADEFWKRKAAMIKESECLVSIQRSDEKNDPFASAIQFRGDQQREVIKVLEEFVQLVRDRERFLNSNSLMGERYSITLKKFINVFPKSIWKIDVTRQSSNKCGEMSLTVAVENNSDLEFSAKECDCEYLLIFLKTINGPESIRDFIRQKKSSEG